MVPVSFSRKVLNVFRNAKKKLVIFNSGDHSFQKKFIDRITNELKNLFNKFLILFYNWDILIYKRNFFFISLLLLFLSLYKNLLSILFLNH